MSEIEKKVVDIEQAKIIAEQIVEYKRETAQLNKQLKNLFLNTEIEISEPLSTGGRLEYSLIESKKTFDYRSYASYLQSLVQQGKTLTKEQIDIVQSQFIVEKEPKWKIKISMKG